MILSAVSEVLLDDNIDWHDILMMVLQDQSQLGLDVYKKLAELYQEHGKGIKVKQLKFNAIELLLHQVDKKRFTPSAYNMALGWTKLELRESFRGYPDRDVCGLLWSSITDEVDRILTYLKLAWSESDEDNLRVLMQAFGAMLYFKNELTPEGKKYLLKPGREADDSILLLVISVMYKCSTDAITKDFLNVAYELALIQPHSKMSDRLFLCFLVANFNKHTQLKKACKPIPNEHVWCRQSMDPGSEMKRWLFVDRGNTYKDDILPYYHFMPDYSSRKHQVQPLNVTEFIQRFDNFRGHEKSIDAVNFFRKTFRGNVKQVFFLRSIEFLNSVSTYMPGLFKSLSMRDLIDVKY